MAPNAPNFPAANWPRFSAVSKFPSQTEQERIRARGCIVAWVFALVLYFPDYIVLSIDANIKPVPDTLERSSAQLKTLTPFLKRRRRGSCSPG
jgi:hypothetical protein